MQAISTEEYQIALNKLSQGQLNTLITLYNCPNSTATADGLAKLLNPNPPHQILASEKIGRIGIAISKNLNKIPEDHSNGRKLTPAYFSVIALYIDGEGWQMTENLKVAMHEWLQENRSVLSKA